MTLNVLICGYYIVIGLICIFSFHQKTLPAITTFVRNFASEKSLKDVLIEKIPQEQEAVKAFRKSHGSTKVGEVTVDMVSNINQV